MKHSDALLCCLLPEAYALALIPRWAIIEEEREEDVVTAHQHPTATMS